MRDVFWTHPMLLKVSEFCGGLEVSGFFELVATRDSAGSVKPGTTVCRLDTYLGLSNFFIHLLHTYVFRKTLPKSLCYCRGSTPECWTAEEHTRHLIVPRKRARAIHFFLVDPTIPHEGLPTDIWTNCKIFRVEGAEWLRFSGIYSISPLPSEHSLGERPWLIWTKAVLLTMVYPCLLSVAQWIKPFWCEWSEANSSDVVVERIKHKRYQSMFLPVPN